MVLKKSKGSLPRTGNTVRKGGRQSMQQALKTAFVTKRNNDVTESPSDELFEGDKYWDTQTPISLNKRNRWMIRERLDERCAKYDEQDEMIVEPKSKRKSSKKSSRKQQKAEAFTAEKKTKIIDKTLLSGPKECRSVYDLKGDNNTVKRGKSWRSRRDGTDDSSYDTVYEITSGLPSKSWPLNITSQWRSAEKYYESIYIQIQPSKNRKKVNNVDDLMTDFSTLETDTDFEEEPDTYDAQAPSLFDRAEHCNTFMLSDFTVPSASKKKHQKSVKSKGNQLSNANLEEDKDRELVYIEVEDIQVQEILEEDDSQADMKEKENANQMEEEAMMSENVSYCHSLDGYLQMENVAVDMSTILKSRLEHLYGKGFFEGRSLPRKFGIILNFADQETGEDNKCFVIAEETKADTLYSEATLSLKLIGKEEHVAELAYHINRSGPYAFENLNIHKSQPLSMVIRTKNENPDTPEHLRSLTRWSPKSLPAEKAFTLLVEDLFLKTEEEEADKDHEKSIKHVEVVSFQCGICFEDLTMLPADEPMMQLEKCLHSFCRSCWLLYLNQKARDQVPVITCPEHGCKEAVDIITILSILDEKLIKLYLKSKFEQFLAKRDDWQWCPGCERVANCPGYSPQETQLKVCDTPVLKCSCDKTWCFKCQDSQHWPLDCEGMRRYKTVFEKERENLFNDFGKIYETNVLVKYCPYCHTPIDKDGGCNNMYCTCGRSFCWRCAKPYCGPSSCKEAASKSITFTSFDSFGEKGDARAVRKALKFSYIKKELQKRKTKLGITRQSTSIAKKHTNNSLMGLMCKLFVDLMNTCTVVEHIAATACVSKSKHYKMRLYRFTGSMDSMLTNINDTLKQDHVVLVNMKEVNYIADRIKNQLAKFISMELNKGQL